MNWRAKAAWIYQGNVPDFVKAKLHGIEVIYVDLRSGNAQSVIAAIRQNGLLPGAYFADSWAAGETGIEFADRINRQLNALLPKGTLAEAPPYMLDVESHPIGWSIDLLNRLYEHQPKRPTAYTVMPFQGTNTPTVTLRTRGIHLYPQLYHDIATETMVANDPAAVILEAARYGMPANMIHPFYDGARFGTDHRDGCYFTLERMP